MINVEIKDSDTEKLAKGVGLSFGGKIAGKFFYIVGQVLVARFYGPELFGLYAIGWSMLRIAGLLSPLGLDNAVIHFATKYWRSHPGSAKSIIMRSWLAAVTSGLLIGTILYILAPWLSVHLFNKPDLTSILLFFSPAFMFFAGLRVASATTRISQRMKYSALAEDIFQPLSNLVLIVILFYLGLSIEGAVGAAVSSFFLACVLAIYFSRKIYPTVFLSTADNTVSLIKLFSFSLPASLAAVFTTFIIMADRFIIGVYRSSYEVGIYQAASQSSIIVSIILSSIIAIFAPMISEFYHNRQIDRLDRAFKVSTRWGLYISLPVLLVIVFFPTELLVAVFGSKYSEGSLPLVILSLGQLVNAGTGPVGILMVMTGRQKKWLLMSAIVLVVNVTLNVMLVQSLGLFGVSIGTASTLSGLFLWALLDVKKNNGLWPYDSKYLKCITAAIISAVILLILKNVIIIESSLLLLLLAVCVSLMSFVTTLYLLGFSEDDKVLISTVRFRLRI